MKTERPDDTSFDEACRFLIELGTATHGYGVSSYRLESYLTRASRALGFSGEFIVTPAYIQFVFWRGDDVRQVSHISRMGPSVFDMAKLAQVSELVDQIEAGTLSLDEGGSHLENIGKQAPIYGCWMVALGYALSGAGFAVLMSASWSDVILAAVLSLVVYAVALLAGRSKWVAHTLELSSALIASLIASVVAILHPGTDPFIVTLCSVIVLIPGLALTLGLAELCAKHIVSGMSRLMTGVLITLKLFIGAAIGTGFVNAVATLPAAVVPPAIPAVWTWMFMALLVVGLALTFQVRPKDFAWTVLGGLLAYAGVVIGGHFGFWQGSFLGALLLGVYASLFARRLHRPASIVMLTAIMVLVPGASAYRGLEALRTSGAASGLTAEWQVLVNILAIIAGVVVSATLVPPKTNLSAKE
jgi:uncharacterized membrane protein YjjP (DUF1212 family)